jgi:hypothetical protein
MRYRIDPAQGRVIDSRNLSELPGDALEERGVGRHERSHDERRARRVDRTHRDAVEWPPHLAAIIDVRSAQTQRRDIFELLPCPPAALLAAVINRMQEGLLEPKAREGRRAAPFRLIARPPRRL